MPGHCLHESSVKELPNEFPYSLRVRSLAELRMTPLLARSRPQRDATTQGERMELYFLRR